VEFLLRFQIRWISFRILRFMWYMRIIWITMCLMRWFMRMQQVKVRILRGIEVEWMT